MRSQIGWRKERSIPYKSVETSPNRHVLKFVRLTAICNRPKRCLLAVSLNCYKWYQSQTPSGVRLWAPKGWIMRSHTGWKGERNIPYKGVETSPIRHVLKIVRLTVIHNRPKRTTSTNGGLELLQMVSELDTERCATLGSQGGGL